MSPNPKSSSSPAIKKLPSQNFFKLGFHHGARMPAIMVGCSMIGFGALVSSAGMSIWIAIVSTLGVWGMPGQVAFVEYYLLGLPVLSLVLAVAMANMRFFPMSLSLVPLFRASKRGWRWRYLWVQLMSINTWAGLLRRSPELEPDDRGPYYAGFSTACMSAACVGTALGFFLAESLPFVVTVTLVFLNPVYFIFLMVSMRARAGLLAFAAGGVLGPAFYPISPEWSLPFVGILAGTIGFLLDRRIRRAD